MYFVRKAIIGAAFYLMALLGTAVHAAPLCGGSVTCVDTYAQVTNASGTTQVTIVTASGNGLKINRVYAYLTGFPTVAQYVTLYTVHGGTSYPLLQTYLQPSSGQISQAQPAVDLLTSSSGGAPLVGLPTDENGNTFITLAAGDSLTIAFNTGPQSGAVATIRVIGQQY